MTCKCDNEARCDRMGLCQQTRLPYQRQTVAALTDAQAESLIEESGGYWKEDVFCIEGGDLMNPLRAASTSGVGVVDHQTFAPPDADGAPQP